MYTIFLFFLEAEKEKFEAGLWALYVGHTCLVADSSNCYYCVPILELVLQQAETVLENLRHRYMIFFLFFEFPFIFFVVEFVLQHADTVIETTGHR